MQKTDHHVANRGHDLRRVATAHLTGVFMERHIANIVQSIFNAPVASVEFQQGFGRGLLRRQARDRIDAFERHLVGLEMTDQPIDTADLLACRPIDALGIAGGQRSDFQPSVPLVAFGRLAREGRGVVDLGGDVGFERGLIAFDWEQVVPFFSTIVSATSR